MAAGPGLGSLIPVALSLAAVVSLLRARARRRAGPAPVDAEGDRRQAAAAEMERRMASYLAGRETGSGYGAAPDQDEQESRR